MKLKPFAEIIALSKEKLAESLAPIRARKVKSQAELEMAKLAESLAPIRARKVKSQAELEMAKLDDELIRLEADIQEQCSKEDINFPSLLDKLDKAALLERRKSQYAEVLAQLFPAPRELS